MSDERTAELAKAIDTLRDRRAVLRGAAVVGLAGVSVPLLAACGGGDEAGSTPSSTGSSSAPTSAPTSAPSSAPSSAGTPSSGGGGAVLGPASDVPVNGGMVFQDAKVVVTQPTAGQYKGFTAVCTHAGCLVRTVENNTITCPCHGSKYNATDGSVISGPAPAPLAAVPVAVDGTNIVASA
ncbi:nitrite reductase/ring-hydroxylating ferredoxin subunit [Kribbella orskensis]|uniref:Cytochrome bc1 complex Rieske iron-sulfur subunit n=1 Tax=Kribbella orskensis TaxID=2512216 RepID=A0ABY2BJ18_9ACTN|nr:MULTISPECIES: Rieske (2Fe-2S) protein [Kribbella]TCN38026.1 nitrite reductase/ring-hydroxylating ferredoxin subunit [Kribbella sp. VKM Ac-2500]TCO19513.1 nitrite reductase/ring-hydroxylating ferredoxin subunit [Kribbella orskensis]